MANVIDWIETKWYQFKREFNIRRFFERVGIWLSYWKVTKNVYDFDYSGLLYLERHQLKRMIKSISYYQSHVNWKTDVMWMKICVSLLDIILGDEDYYDFIIEKDMTFISCEDNSHISTVIPGKYKYIFKKHININNAKRYVNSRILRCDEYVIKISVHEAKAWDLYHRIRTTKLQDWWD